MSNWKTYRLGELGIVITGKTPSSKTPGHFGGHIPFVTPTDFSQYIKTARIAERFLSKEGSKNLAKKVLPENSILVTCIGSQMGKVAVNKVKVVTNQQLNSLIPDDTITDADFLYYLITSMQDYLRNLATGGSTMPIINKNDFENIEVQLPPLPEQKAIASILSSLDDKIELNNRINKNLEALAQAIFKQWFIDFEFPNDNGDPYKSSGGKMVESELGEIPKGWDIGTFENVVKHRKENVKPFDAPDTIFDHYSIPAYDEDNVPAKETGDSIKSNKYRVFSNSILVSKLNPRFPRIWLVGEIDDASSI